MGSPAFKIVPWLPLFYFFSLFLCEVTCLSDGKTHRRARPRALGPNILSSGQWAGASRLKNLSTVFLFQYSWFPNLPADGPWPGQFGPVNEKPFPWPLERKVITRWPDHYPSHLLGSKRPDLLNVWGFRILPIYRNYLLIGNGLGFGELNIHFC